MSLVVKPHHLRGRVPHLEDALEWYRVMLEFESRVYIDIIPADMVFIHDSNFRIELSEVEGATALPEERRLPNLYVT